MSQELINHSPDLRRLRDEGYQLEIKGAFAFLHNVPYVNSLREIQVGTLVSPLQFSGNKTIKPNDHVIYFIGEQPCNKDGQPILGIMHQSSKQQLGDEINVDRSFSNKPPEGYQDYYHKFSRYIEIIEAPAKFMDPQVKANLYLPVKETSIDSPFHYVDTHSSRANIGAISDKLRSQRIGIVGLGGTGSYVLDYIAKTPVSEIHLFDGDEFLQHNAFRAPGCPSFHKLEERLNKANYFACIYSNMKKSIYPHPENVSKDNVNLLLDCDFVFLCIDDGEAKKDIISSLVEHQVPLIDVGIDVKKVDNALLADVRTTTVTLDQKDHVGQRISFSTSSNNEYESNIQISELNAAFAVIKWKKLLGFYHDHCEEVNSVYSTNTGGISND
jgi:hypothetical protein